MDIMRDIDIGVESGTEEYLSVSPTEEFNNFSYKIKSEDNDLDDLRKDVLLLNDSIDSTLNYTNVTPSDSELAVREICKNISQKYNIEVGYNDFRDMIHDIANTDNNRKELMDAIISKVSTNVIQRANLKIVLSLSKLIDRMLTLIEREADNLDYVTSELIGCIDRCMSYYTQLQGIRDSLTVIDPDKTFERISYTQNNKNNFDNGKKIDIKLINDIIENIKNEGD